MTYTLQDLAHAYDLNISGIIHIGAHFGEEYFMYRDYNIEYMLFIEPCTKNFDLLKLNIPKSNKIKLIKNALGNKTDKVKMFVESANQGQSNSILEPDLHAKQYPFIEFNGQEIVDMVRLDDIVSEKIYNFINIDVQGYELEALKGASNYLHNIDYIYSEINRDSVYKNCTLVNDLDEFLSKYGFVRLLTEWCGQTWGEGFYIKKQLV